MAQDTTLIAKFADDTKLAHENTCPDNHETLQNCIRNVITWQHGKVQNDKYRQTQPQLNL